MKKRSDAQQKKLADDARLLRWWKAWHREQRDEALTRYPNLAELFRMFKNLEHLQPAQLIGFTQSIDWTTINYDTKLVVIHEINNAITAFREKQGLELIDDNLPGEPETPFRQIKAIMFSPPREGANRGAVRHEHQSSAA
jgi:hypothetical protein